MTLYDNIHCIRERTGLRLKRMKRMLYAVNHPTFNKPGRCQMSLKPAELSRVSQGENSGSGRQYRDFEEFARTKMTKVVLPILNI